MLSINNIEPEVVDQWQQITNLVTGICNVPATLIMRQNAHTMEGVVGSQHSD